MNDRNWKEVVEVFRENFEDDTLNITAETTASDVQGWDSIAHVKLLIALEDRFRIRFTTGEAARMENVGHMVEYIEKRLREQGRG